MGIVVSGVLCMLPEARWLASLCWSDPCSECQDLWDECLLSIGLFEKPGALE